MKKLFGLFLLLLPLWVVAAERNAADAAELAAKFLSEQYAQSPQRKRCNASSMSLNHTRNKINSNAPAFYVFNQTAGEGFVVISGDDRTEDVLMYSDEGSLDVATANPSLLFWLKYLQEQISAADDENTYSAEEKRVRKATNVTAISPLLVNKKGKSITWAQEAPYYNQCPQYESKYCMTGCVATAAAQVMYMWRHPEKGTGSNSYKTSSKGISVSQDFSQVTFDWDNMLPAYQGKSSTDAQKNAVAWLMRCCGVACNMDYSPDGSGSLTDKMAKGLTTYFNYTFDKFITMYARWQYGTPAIPNNKCIWSATTDTFVTYFNANLEAGRPILMGGEDGTNGGHEFVCDGRDASGKYHINWGWEGSGNCYCTLTALKPQYSSYDFSSNIDALVGLRPNVVDTVHVTGVRIVPEVDTLKINQKDTLKAVVTPEDATVKDVTWSSENPAIAFVSSDGVVRGVATGTTTITATTVDGNKTAHATIVVTNEIEPLALFKWLLDASQLEAGDDIILVANYGDVYYAMDNIIHTTNTTYYASTEIQQMDEDSTILLADASKTAIFKLGGSAGQWTLTESTYGQLGAKAAKKITWNDGTQTWSIAIGSLGVATIQSTTSSYGKILFYYNNGTPRYSTYKSISDGYLAPMLFVRKGEHPTGEEQVQQSPSVVSNGVKMLIDGQLVILKNNKIYTILGQER